MNKRKDLIKKIAGTAIFCALTVVLTIVSNYIQIAGTAINLGLIPIVLAAIIYGPVSGLIVGVANGVLVITGAQAYLAISVVGTILTCLLKTGVAGYVAGVIYKALKDKNFTLAVVLAALLTPVLNTTIYIIGCLIFFSGQLGALISIFITANFLIEFAINIALTPAIMHIVKYATTKKA